MTFSELTSNLLTLPNCAIVVRGLGFIDDLHSFVRESSKIVAKIEQPHSSEQAEGLKKQLERILNNYDNSRRLPVRSKPPKK